MAETKQAPRQGDACPQCGGQLVAVPEPTADQRRAAADRENGTPLPAHVDNATEQQRKELGGLYKCAQCGYRTRIRTSSGGRGDQGGQAGGARVDETGAGGAASAADKQARREQLERELAELNAQG